jgi:hypothetical protein
MPPSTLNPLADFCQMLIAFCQGIPEPAYPAALAAEPARKGSNHSSSLKVEKLWFDPFLGKTTGFAIEFLSEIALDSN